MREWRPRDLSFRQRDILAAVAERGGSVCPAVKLRRGAGVSKSEMNSTYRSVRRLRARGLVAVTWPLGVPGGGMRVSLTEKGRALVAAMAGRRP